MALIGTYYWRGLLDWIADRPLATGKISPEDVSLLHVTDDVAEAVGLIRESWQRAGTEPPVHEPEKADAE